MSRFLRNIDAINERAGNITAYFIIAMMGLLLFEVISRYFFNKTNYWIIETSTFFLIAYFFLAGGYVLLHRRHIVMDLFYSRFPLKVRLAVDMATIICIFCFVGLMLWKSIEITATSWRIQEFSISLWGPPLYPIKTVMTVGFIFFFLQAVAGFTRTAIALFSRAD